MTCVERNRHISVAFHPRSNEIIIVRQLTESKTFQKKQQLKAAIKETRKASREWPEWSAAGVGEMSIKSYDVNSCAFRRQGMTWTCMAQPHGDIMICGPPEHVETLGSTFPGEEDVGRNFLARLSPKARKTSPNIESVLMTVVGCSRCTLDWFWS